MNRSRIEWCDYTFNVITGCRHDCPYCYARKMALRFKGDTGQNIGKTGAYLRTEDGLYVLENAFKDENGSTIMYPFGFEPTFHKYRLDQLNTIGNGKRIFVGALTDMFGNWVPEGWIGSVMDACLEQPQHMYLFLTKNPGRYKNIPLPEGDHFWYGTSVTRQMEVERILHLPKGSRQFISIEPILEKVTIPDDYLKGIGWILIGAETGIRKGKIIPSADWVKDIVLLADEHGIPVFMKDSLITVVGEDNMRRKYPPELLLSQEKQKGDPRLYAACLLCKKPAEKMQMVTLDAKVGQRSIHKTICMMCRSCFETWCREHGIEGYTEELFVRRR